MNSFLHRVAKAYFSEYKESITDFTFVFPNRRAGLFFQRYISRLSDKPLFSPGILTINECFSLASPWQAADRLSNLFRLYSIYKKQSGSTESFDSFVFWGEMLLSDFDEVDKYRIDARQLFTNITDLHQIDKLFDIFTEKQVEAIRQFWKNFVPVREGKSQEEFRATWKILLSVYDEFRASLMAENTATEGMVCRDVADRLHAGEEIGNYSGKQFVFVGFNALTPCEKKLMEIMQKRGQADFYWDYEAEQLRDPDNNASRFYAENVHAFPSRFTIEPVVEPLHEKNFELVAVPSAVGQTKQVFSILDGIFPAHTTTEQEWIKTAVVLPDESLLIPLLHSLPAQIGKVNVTMGFPLKSTPVSGLIEHIFELQRRMRVSDGRASFYHQTVTNILNHQYIAMLCKKQATWLTRWIAENNLIYIDSEELKKNPLLAAIFEPQTDSNTFLPYLLKVLLLLQGGWQNATDESHNYQLECDFLYEYYTTINRMVDIINTKPADIELSTETLIRMTRQITASLSLPFVGEPLDGLQVMGVLETRGLDFEHLIITSFNENTYPPKHSFNSFIPYNLRRGFDLPTGETQDALTAYNFYRLIHRAKHVYFLYDSRTEGIQTGEVSRFIHQLQYHYGVNIRKKNVSFDISFDNTQALQIEKSAAVMDKLLRFASQAENSPALSASSINTYIDCPMQFYLTKVEDVAEADEVVETVEASMFGTLFHRVMEKLYQPYTGRLIHETDFEQMVSNTPEIDKEIARAFASEYFKKKNNSIVPLEGNNLLIASVLRKYILQVLKIDKKRAPFRYIASEEACNYQLPIFGGRLSVNLKGFIDRIDEKDGHLRIIDYKTGKGKLEFKSLPEVFEHNKENRQKFVLQTFLYALFYKKNAGDRKIIPGIYYLRNLFDDSFDTELRHKPDRSINQPVTDFSIFEEEFCSHLTSCLEEIFDPSIPFVQTENSKACQYCPYTGICNRQ